MCKNNYPQSYMEYVVVSEIEIQPIYNKAEVIFVFGNSPNKTRFCVNGSIKDVEKYQSMVNEKIPYEYFMENIFNKQKQHQ